MPDARMTAITRYLDVLHQHARQFFGAAVLVLVVSGCDQGYTSFGGQTMGTYYTVSYDSGRCQLEPRDFTTKLDGLNRSMSTYIADSELMTINQGDAGAYQLSEPLAKVLTAAIVINEVTGGAFDVSIGPLVELWGFGTHAVDHMPTVSAQERASANVGQELWDLRAQTLFKRTAGLQLNLSAIAKGYAVDELAALAVLAGCTNYMIDIGGEIRVAGDNPAGQSWRLGIELPDASQLGMTAAVIEVRDRAIATSGDYRNYQMLDNRRVHHIFDPRLGRPVQSQVVSATVLHPSAMIADGYATAFLVLPPAESLAIADAQGLAVYLMYQDPSADSTVESVYNEAMQQYLSE